MQAKREQWSGFAKKPQASHLVFLDSPALVTCAWAGGTAALDRLHRYFVPCQMPIATSGDYTVFQGDSIVKREPRAVELLDTLANNMMMLLNNGK